MQYNLSSKQSFFVHIDHLVKIGAILTYTYLLYTYLYMEITLIYQSMSNEEGHAGPP